MISEGLVTEYWSQL